MPTKPGSLHLLDGPLAQRLLHSTEMAQLAYSWTDGTPRVVPIWFTWTGSAIVVASPPTAPKVPVLQQNPAVALTINTNMPPYKVLLIRGRADIEMVAGLVPEYAAAANRYFGEEQGAEWCHQVGRLFSHMARIAIMPTWVKVLDFETRFPKAIADATANKAGRGN